MRHSSFSRSTRNRLQKLTAFLTAIAIIAGFLPLGAVKVSANVGTVDCEVVVENEDNNNYTSQVAVQYMANTEADPNDDASWTDIAPNAGTSVYSFPATAKDGDDIHVRFILSKVEGENDPRVITGFKATVGDKQIIPVVDERLSDDLCTLTVPFDTTAGVSKVAIRVSLPNNLEFTQTNESNIDFYQFLLNRNLGSLTIPSDKTLEIFGASVIITGNLVLQENAKLRIQNNKEGEQIISTGTLTAGSIVGANNATIMFESKANIPSGFTFYRWGENGPEEVDPSDIPDDMYWFEIYYDSNESKWILNEFDPFSFSVVVDDNSNLVGASLVYKAEYSLNGGTDWTEANFAENLPNNFSGLKNISGGTVTFDSANRDLKELFFRLPDDVSTWVESPEGSGNWIEVYPNVMFRITIMNADEFETTAVTIGGGDDKINLTSVTESGNIIFTSSALNTDVIPHDIRLTLDSGFDRNDYYGLSVQIPMDENSGYSVSADDKTVTLDSFGNNKLIVESTKPIIVENIPGTETDPTLTVLWSASDKFDLTATTDGTTAYIYNATEEGSRDKLSADDPFTVTCSTKGTPVTADVNFEKPCLSFSGYASITPAPGTGDNWEGDLTAASYDVVFENGTVTVELLGTDSAWYGHLEHRFDEQDNDYIDEFRIETTAQVKLTFTPDDGYEVDPWAIENFKLDDDLSCTYTMSTENNHINNPFREEGSQPEGSSAVFNGAINFTDTATDDGIIRINYDHGYAEIQLQASDEYEIKQENETAPVVFSCGSPFKVTLYADDDYEGSISMNGQFLSNNYWNFDGMGANTPIDIEFNGATFILEIEGALKDGTEPEINEASKTITLTYDNGTIVISEFESYVESLNPTEFRLEGDSVEIQVTAAKDYSYYLLLDGKNYKTTNGLVEINGIAKDNRIKFEAKFDPTPQLVIGSGYTFDSQEGTMTFYDGTTKLGTVTIQGNPFSNPQAPNLVDNDLVFSIVPEDDYVCFVQLNGNQREYYSGGIYGTYTLDKNQLASTPEGTDPNSLLFSFEKIDPDKRAKVELNGKYELIGNYEYKIDYGIGWADISVSGIEGTPEYNPVTDTTTFTLLQSESSFGMHIGSYDYSTYTPKVVEYGDDWENPLTIWMSQISLPVNPENNSVYKLKVIFEQTGSNEAYVTYTYKGEPANIEIGGNLLPSGTLNNKLITFTDPLTPDEDGYVEFKFSVHFIFYMEDLTINGESYNKYLPDSYEELIEAFGSQFTNITVKVPMSDSYVIETTAYDAERENPDRLAVGNFLWFYDYNISIANSGSGDDYVENATLKVLQVQIKDQTTGEWGEPITTPIEGTAIDWEPITAVVNGEEEVVGGAAVLPAGSKVTMQLIPDYGTQLVKLGLNGEGFEVDQDEMYTYSFIVGPGNFHLNASFVPIADVVEDSTNTIDGGSIALGEGTVDNGTAVLYVKDANVTGAEKDDFENLATDEALAISSYLDISLDKVVYQGVSADEVKYSGDDKNVWNKSLEDLAKPAEITLTVSDDVANEIGTGTVKVLHNHNGTLEVIDADYNPATKELTFKTSSFSDYAIAVEAEQYKVTFNANGHGTAPAAQTVTSGSKATKPTDPTATGYKFGGWFTDAACTKAYDFSTAVTGSITLYAKWTAETYTVTFNTNGGSAVASQKVEYNKTATKPADPTKAGYTFGGWYTDSACTKAYSFGTKVTGSITLYAKWTAVTTTTPAPTATATPAPTATATPSPTPVASADLLGGGVAHVQDFGDTPVSVDPATGILTIGTTGMGKRLEEITIEFENTTGYEGTMEYRVHVQDKGWLPWTEAGNPAGTEGESKRIEAIEIRLTGELAKYYSVEYCVHIQDYGDMQGWVKDGALAGTTGESKRIEQIKVRIVPKGTGTPMAVNYRVHVQDYGWEKSYATNGAMAGTSGESKRLEGIEIFLSGTQYGGGIQYKTHVQNIGWESAWAKDGEMSGTQGQALRLEGISIELYGEVAEYYDIYYRVHAQDIGWLSWAKNGEYAGTAGRSARLEGIQIVLVPKGSPAPGATYMGITAVDSRAFVEGF